MWREQQMGLILNSHTTRIVQFLISRNIYATALTTTIIIIIIIILVITIICLAVSHVHVHKQVVHRHYKLISISKSDLHEEDLQFKRWTLSCSCLQFCDGLVTSSESNICSASRPRLRYWLLVQPKEITKQPQSCYLAMVAWVTVLFQFLTCICIHKG